MWLKCWHACRGRTGLARNPSSPIPTLDQQLASYVSPGMGMAAAVGLEDAVDDLVDLLCNAEEPCQIVNIVGPAGFGEHCWGSLFHA